MKKFLLSCAFLLSFAVQAQIGPVPQLVIDQKEDTTQVVSIADIVNVQELVTANSSTASHFNSVWGRKKYFNIAYDLGATNLKPQSTIETGYNDGIVPTYKADWGAGLILGCSYGLHKKPIANVVKFNLDYTYIDLNVANFKASGQAGEKVYDSSAKWTDDSENYYYIPWGLDKWKIDYGMSLGPSITIAPFTYINRSPGLHFLKLNAYYHIGYHVSAIFMKNDSNRDANTNQTSYNQLSGLNGVWGHGLTSTFGFSLSWKAIGVGYELRNTNVKYKSLSPSLYGNKDYKFKTDSGRIYLSIRY